MALTIAAAIREAGVDPATLPLKLGLFGGEPWTERMRAELDRQLSFKAVNLFGLSEMCGPGVAAECVEQRNGLHAHEDHFLAEVIDPEAGDVLELGAEGELVFTTLSKEALPLVRYRTGDIGRLTTEPCPCGRRTARTSGPRGRIDDMVVIRGVNVYPSNVEHLLLGVEGIAPVYRLTVQRPEVLDELTLECEAARGVGEDARQTMAGRSWRCCASTWASGSTCSCSAPARCPAVKAGRFGGSTAVRDPRPALRLRPAESARRVAPCA